MRRSCLGLPEVGPAVARLGYSEPVLKESSGNTSISYVVVLQDIYICLHTSNLVPPTLRSNDVQ